MNFFAAQDQARRTSRRLVFVYLLATILIVAGVTFVVGAALFYSTNAGYGVTFGTMLRQLPGETEIPSLIVDISQTGLAAGLQEKLFQPQPEIPRDFYAEKPIKIRLSGGYHEMANFVSGIAALPRIVTLHDINITPETRDTYDQLSLEVTAQTYRYLDEEVE